jgi:hypothetical protein
VERLPARVHSTPLELITQLQAGVEYCPLMLQRRRNIFRWMEHCLRKILPPGNTRPRHTNISPTSWPVRAAHLTELSCGAEEPLTDTRQRPIMTSGKWIDKQWETPGDRRMMWMFAEHLSSDRGVSVDEAAVPAILSSYRKKALSNPSLRSWEKSLHAACRSIMGRLEDELLHVHDTNRRVMRPPFPGTDYESQEREQLFATSDCVHDGSGDCQGSREYSL